MRVERGHDGKLLDTDAIDAKWDRDNRELSNAIVSMMMVMHITERRLYYAMFSKEVKGGIFVEYLRRSMARQRKIDAEEKRLHEEAKERAKREMDVTCALGSIVRARRPGEANVIISRTNELDVMTASSQDPWKYPDREKRPFWGTAIVIGIPIHGDRRRVVMMHGKPWADNVCFGVVDCEQCEEIS